MRKPNINTRSLRRGGYLAAVTAAVAALVVLINLVVGQLPSHWTELDLTDNGLYEISDTSRDFLAGLDQDVEIVVLAEEGNTDERILKFLDRYAALSDHLSLTFVDPVAHPEEASAYDTQSNSLIVRCEATGKSQTISYNDIITYSYTSYFSMTEDSFDGEGQITSAVNYVTSDANRTVYTVTGHGEEDLSDYVTDAIDKANLNLDSVSPLFNGSVPEDCDLLLVNGPATDLSADELTILQDYLAGGGQMIFVAGDTLDALPNWEALLESRGFDLADGYIADLSNYYVQFGSPFVIRGVLNTGSDVASGVDSDALTYLENSRGFLSLEDTEDAAWTITSFLSTTSDALAVTADGTQTSGTYLLGAVSQGDDGGRLTVLGSTSFLDGTLLAQNPSLANLTLFTNALTAGFEDVSNLSIPAKNLAVTYNTIQNPGLWSTTYLIILPVGFLLCGFLFWLRRRKL